MRRLRADRRAGLLFGGVMFATLLALGSTVALPASDPEIRSTEGAASLDELEAHGFEVYRNEGCWYCHTQAVRSTPVDDAYGDPLPVSAYAGRSPAMVGAERIGPDLTHVGSRFDTSEAVVELLRDPRADGRDSLMPSYAHLSSGDLEALAAYLLSLQ